jgi:hypothetical protein
LYWCNNPFFCRQCSGQRLHTFSRICCKMSQ